jgi:hypothetical protein
VEGPATASSFECLAIVLDKSHVLELEISPGDIESFPVPVDGDDDTTQSARWWDP